MNSKKRLSSCLCVFILISLFSVSSASACNETVVAILDEGLNIGSYNLSSYLWVNSAEIPGDGIDNDGNGQVDDVNGWNFIDGNNDISEAGNHGTLVAANVRDAAISTGACGLKIMPVKVSNGGHVVSGVNYARTLGVKIIVIPREGASTRSQRTALSYASSQGVLIFAGAGNDNSPNGPTFPGSHADVHAVAAMTGSAKTPSSNYGSGIAFAAQGSATSYASGIAGGIAAGLKMKFPTLTYSQVINAMYETLRDQNSGFDLGAGEAIPSFTLAGNGEVGFSDFLNISRAYGSLPGDSNWNPLADVDGDWDVDFEDFLIYTNSNGSLVGSSSYSFGADNS